MTNTTAARYTAATIRNNMTTRHPMLDGILRAEGLEGVYFPGRGKNGVPATIRMQLEEVSEGGRNSVGKISFSVQPDGAETASPLPCDSAFRIGLGELKQAKYGDFSPPYVAIIRDARGGIKVSSLIEPAQPAKAPAKAKEAVWNYNLITPDGYASAEAPNLPVVSPVANARANVVQP